MFFYCSYWRWLIDGTGKTDGVGIERAIQTQRNALLRLLAGWLALMLMLSALPVSPVWTRRVRVFLSGFVGVAEAAARYLVIAQARVIARRLGMTDPVRDARLVFDSSPLRCSEGGEPLTLAELRVRMLALRCLLKHLPGRGLRLLQRLLKPRDVGVAAQPLAEMRRQLQFPAGDQCAPASPWHPPKGVRTIAVDD